MQCVVCFIVLAVDRQTSTQDYVCMYGGGALAQLVACRFRSSVLFGRLGAGTTGHSVLCDCYRFVWKCYAKDSSFKANQISGTLQSSFPVGT
jgi:hypothetical protein